MKIIGPLSFPLLLLVFACEAGNREPTRPETPASEITLLVLGNVQDAGSPHIACRKDCCRDLFDRPDPTRQVISLGIIDHTTGKTYLLEASPDLPRQAKNLSQVAANGRELPDGIFLTHAHIGHYAGLMYLGKEATNAKSVPVYGMTRMRDYLSSNGPWSQLVANDNIALRKLTADSAIVLSPDLKITPFLVPHRDEYSETVGYLIEGPLKKALFIPDIDKWEKWDRPIETVIGAVDYAFLDATFYDAAELNTRDISQIPHPFVSESMERFSSLPPAERSKIHFLHFNHTNRLLDRNSAEYRTVHENMMNVADYGEQFQL